jgi:hypothetical protein
MGLAEIGYQRRKIGHGRWQEKRRNGIGSRSLRERGALCSQICMTHMVTPLVTFQD